MIFYRTKYVSNNWLRIFCMLLVAFLPMVSTVQATIIVDDSWADGGRTNGVDAQDTDWWASTTASAIEVAVGSLGLVSGSSGRGIHGTFAAQSLNVGDSLKTTSTFTTPATVRPGSAAFRFGLFDTTGKPGLAADISASSGTPNAIYNNLPGYMMDLDVNLATNDENISMRERSNPASGQLMATTADYTSLTAGGNTYKFLANTSYTVILSVKRTGLDTLDITGSLSQGNTELSSYTATDASGIASTFGMLAFHVTSNVFGSVNTVNTPNNGIDFTNIKIEYCAIPEPASLILLGCAGAFAFASRRLRRN
ncbi:MAG: PEP-CTERM sorting domain-containing protein [Bythopirellula sp.]|nr:PEP-CTERM sorting domain-containing protein [Bythopirellula sp.]